MATAFDKAVEHHQAGRPDLAEGVLRRALGAGGKASGDPRLESLLAMVLSLQGKHQQAEHYFSRALAGPARTPALLTNYGNMLLLTGRSAEARPQFEAALAIDPSFPPAWLGLSPALHHLADSDGSIAAARRAHALAPGDSSAKLNLASALTGAGYVEEALEVSRAGLEADPANPKLITNYLMSLHYPWGIAPDFILHEHRRWGARLAAPDPVDPRRLGGPRSPDRRLRVGFLSADLRAHVVALFARPLVEHRDPQAIDAVAYSLSLPDAASALLRPLFDTWHDCAGLTDHALAARIRADRIDILIDLNGHTEGTRIRLLAARLAPIQGTAIGYPDTTGVPNVDFRLVDAVTDPPGADLATERLVRLPRCFLCYTPPLSAPDPQPRDPAAPITFGSFNAAPKINNALLELWGRLLARTPGSRLMLKNRALASARRREEVLGRLAAGAGLDLASRVDLIGWTAAAVDHLAAYRGIDIALDSLPYNGTTTTCEALWMGVPVVTVAGSSHVSRVGVSLLSAVGMPELIARDPDHLLDIAARLASDRSNLNALRSSLRSRLRSSPLCDAPAMGRALGEVLRGLWREHCSVG